MIRRFLPGSVIGVMGGGQLGRMFAVAARSMGYRIHIFTPEQDSPASQFADATTKADYRDEEAVRCFALGVDLLTFEFENIPVETMRWCAEEVEIRPAAAIVETAQNRLREKNFFSENGFPVAQFRSVRSSSELVSAVEQIGRASILKTAAFGYDGKGQQSISSRDLEEVWQARSGDELLLERAIDFEKEISVIVARDPEGKVKTFPIGENIHRDHILDFTIVPAELTDSVAKEALAIAVSVAEKLELVGLLAVELFLESDGTLSVNEIAPRPHNSGHWSIEGCVTSQFEQHVRAVCGLPLGSTELVRPSAMANLLGDLWQDGEPEWASALGIANVHLHLYGKHEARPRRKMGHLTAVGRTAKDAEKLVRRAREALCRQKR